jgi:transcriptional regulator with XRE-family HTH domain
VTGDELRAFRRDRRWRQTELAEFLGVDQPAVSEMERGRREVPDELAALLQAAGAAESPAPDAAGDGPPEAAAANLEGDVPPRPVRSRAKPRPVERQVEVNLAELEARLLRLIQGEDVAIAIADPGETEIHHVSQHVPGLADLVGAMNEFDGNIIRANAVAMSKAWVKLAREKPRVLMFLETLTAGGAWRDVFAATGPVVLAILLNHGLLPSLPGMTVVGAGSYDPPGDGFNGYGGGAPEDATASGSLG